MNDRMAQMEEQLQATNEELAASKQRVEQQQAVIQDLDEDRQASSGLSKFLSETEFSGLVAASYTYNFKGLNASAIGRNGNSTTQGENGSLFGITAPYHTNSNNFQVDQLAFRMKKTPTPESRGGWGASIAYGSSADGLAARSGSDASGDLPILVEAYAQYMWDVGDGIKSTAGRYMFPGGAESFWADQNFNVTRGMLWTLQPVNLTGANLSGGLGEDFSWQLGGSNSYSNTMANTDNHPTFVGRVGYKADTLGFGVTGVYGGNVDDLFAAFPSGLIGPVEFATPALGFNSGQERNGDKIGLLDAVLTWDPSDSLATWINFDWWTTTKTGQGTPAGGPGTFQIKDLSIWGIAGAGRYAFTESTGFALRYEYLSFNDFGPNNAVGFSKGDANLMSLTATLDHHLTDNLVLSAEGRWDRARINDNEDDVYIGQVPGNASSGPGLTFADFDKGKDHQVLGIVQLRYDF
jgi:hypothetical protein